MSLENSEAFHAVNGANRPLNRSRTPTTMAHKTRAWPSPFEKRFLLGHAFLVHPTNEATRSKLLVVRTLVDSFKQKQSQFDLAFVALDLLFSTFVGLLGRPSTAPTIPFLVTVPLVTPKANDRKSKTPR